MIKHALDDCPAWHSKINDPEHEGWDQDEIKRIKEAME
jgi:hypothetical protein